MTAEAATFCRLLRHSPSESDEEFRWLIRILKKSKKMGTPIRQRKNGKEKNAVAWFVGFHVAAVRAVVIQSVADEENVDHGGVLSAFSDWGLET